MNAITEFELQSPIGAPFAGGLFAGRFFLGNQPYALVLSPKDSEIEIAQWGPVKKKIVGALSYADGRQNTNAMAVAGSKLAKDLLALRIGDHYDWYLPSRLEALQLFGELPSELERDWYWTSTQCAGVGEYAWIQNFYSGDQDDHLKDIHCRARAVRRVPIE